MRWLRASRPACASAAHPIQLMVRGDDLGCSRSANLALFDCCAAGVLDNVSVMTPGPAFAHAVTLFAGRDDVCLGLHATLNSEWTTPKWGPLLPAHRVPSLVTAEGYFATTPDALRAVGFDADEAMAEVQAQLDTARRHGLRISYLDEHMSVGALTGLGERLAALCAREHLVCAASIPWLPSPKLPPGHLSEWWLHQLRQAPPGRYALVTHPVYDDEEMRAFHGRGHAPGEVASRRDRVRRALLDPAFRQACQDLGVEFARYDGAPIRPASRQ